jgi:hypothetical protein
MYRKGKIAEALPAFKKIYLQMVDDMVDYLRAQDSTKSVD